MSQSALTRRGTGLPDSDVVEGVNQLNLINQYFVLSSPGLGVSTGNATFSIDKFRIMGTNKIYVQATLTGVSVTNNGLTGLNLATGNFGFLALYRTLAGTVAVVAGASGASIGVAVLPTTIPSTAHAFGLILLSCTNTAFTGGTTELDATNGNAVIMNLVGAAAVCVSTAPISTGPGNNP